jgi:antitoxin (DNA-binding transcriptional repressor) of toxin-antitoxin stability system
MTLTVTEFRKNTAKYLDQAIQGKPVTIERGGVVFTLTANVKVTGA